GVDVLVVQRGPLEPLDEGEPAGVGARPARQLERLGGGERAAALVDAATRGAADLAPLAAARSAAIAHPPLPAVAPLGLAPLDDHLDAGIVTEVAPQRLVQLAREIARDDAVDHRPRTAPIWLLPAWHPT